jgi:hypothetical protein
MTRIKRPWCPGAESNHRHRDFQSRALPTELPGRPPGAGPTGAPRYRDKVRHCPAAAPARVLNRKRACDQRCGRQFHAQGALNLPRRLAVRAPPLPPPGLPESHSGPTASDADRRRRNASSRTAETRRLAPCRRSGICACRPGNRTCSSYWHRAARWKDRAAIQPLCDRRLNGGSAINAAGEIISDSAICVPREPLLARPGRDIGSLAKATGGDQLYLSVMPPSTTSSIPVTYRLSSLAR